MVLEAIRSSGSEASVNSAKRRSPRARSNPRRHLSVERHAATDEMTDSDTEERPSGTRRQVSNSTHEDGGSAEASTAERSSAADSSADKESGETPHGAEDGNVLSPETARTVGVALLGLTAYGTYQLFSPGVSRIVQVFWFSWITAISTGLGAAPWLFVNRVPDAWLGVSNALAAGMMISASIGLIVEGALEPPNVSDDLALDDQHMLLQLQESPAWVRAAGGVLLGWVFIVFTNRFLEKYEHLKFGGLSGMDARKMLLIVAVMTLHSFTEGVAIGVSFGGPRGHSFGVFISTALAIHNVPEGLATSLVLIPRKVSVLQASLWSVLTSIPQPIMAVPAYLAVQEFLPFLPIGLGFAGGAMLYVAIFELLSEAAEELGIAKAGAMSIVAAACMAAMQAVLKD